MMRLFLFLFSLLIAAFSAGCGADSRPAVERLEEEFGYPLYSRKGEENHSGIWLCGATCLPVAPGVYSIDDLAAMGLYKGSVNAVVMTLESLNRGDLVHLQQDVGEALREDVSIADWCFEASTEDNCRGEETIFGFDAIQEVYRAPRDQIGFLIDYDLLAHDIHGFEVVQADPFTVRFYIEEQGIVAE